MEISAKPAGEDTGGYEVPFDREAEDGSVGTGERRWSLWREDLIAALLATTLVLGLFVDGWNHINLQDGALGSFFTPWHGLLYAGFTATAAWVMTRNPHLYRRDRAPKPELHTLFGIPLRYPFAVAGLALATVGMLGDLVWHSVFGEETGVARVIGPFHLILFAGGGALVAAPFRSGWHAPRHYPASIDFKTILPPLLSLTLCTALITFMFQWLSAFIDWRPSVVIGRVPDSLASDPAVAGTIEYAAVARVVVTNLVLVGAVGLALRRWRLPFGSVTFMWTIVALLMSALTELESVGTVFAAAVGGLGTDTLIRVLRPAPSRPAAYRIIAGAAPVLLWLAYFAALSIVHDLVWPRDLWLGTVGLCALTGLAISFVAVPPALPGGAWQGGDVTVAPRR